MTFIVDAQFPKRHFSLLCHLGEDAIHALDLPDANKTADSYIRALSISESRVVISKDTDFLDSHIIHHIPPKLILVTTGNIENDQVVELFTSNWAMIKQTITEHHFIEVSKNQIIIH